MKVKLKLRASRFPADCYFLIILGISLVFVGVVIIIAVSLLSGGSSVGGVILIGPFPIVFGAGPDAALLIVLSVMLTIISLVLFIIMNRRVKRIG